MPSSLALRPPLTYIVSEIAGLTCAPESLPVSRIITASVAPITYAFPPEARTERTRRNVPRNSAIRLTVSIILMLKNIKYPAAFIGV